MGSLSSLLDQLIFVLPAVLVAIVFHEFAHGWVSHRLGDPTPKAEGRLSLNPLHHLDPLGTLFLIVFKFGWAKPVQVNPGYYRHPKQGMAVVAVAGPLMNFLIATLCYLGLMILSKTAGAGVGSATQYAYNFLYICAMINVGLGIFNLIPLPPLDGSKVLGAFLPDHLYYRYMQVEQMGMIVLVLLLMTGLLNKPLYLLRSAVTSVMIWITNGLTFFL